MAKFGYNQPGQFNAAYDPYTKGNSNVSQGSKDHEKKKEPQTIITEEKETKKKKKKKDDSDSDSDAESSSSDDSDEEDDKKKKQGKKEIAAKGAVQGLQQVPKASRTLEGGA